MRAFGVELLQEGIEAGLLLKAVHPWRPCCFLLQGQMHAFMPAVLLGMAWFDALDGNAEPEPPHRKPREVVEAIGRSEGNAVVGADSLGQAALFEQPDKGF